MAEDLGARAVALSVSAASRGPATRRAVGVLRRVCPDASSSSSGARAPPPRCRVQAWTPWRTADVGAADSAEVAAQTPERFAVDLRGPRREQSGAGPQVPARSRSSSSARGSPGSRARGRWPRPVAPSVLEASDGVGGRVRTDTVDGFRLDRGFQVFFTAYPEARRVLGYRALKLRPVRARRAGADRRGLPSHARPRQVPAPRAGGHDVTGWHVRRQAQGAEAQAQVGRAHGGRDLSARRSGRPSRN